jgi:L-ascorbate metabolism protein UlaG (beta-lactamase superfamily)
LILPFLVLFVAMSGVRVRAAEKLTGDVLAADGGTVILHPVNHATLVMAWGDKVVWVDPVGGTGRFEGLPRPDLILITHNHGDHFSVDTLRAVAGGKTILVAPPSVAAQLPEPLRAQTVVVTNGQTHAAAGITIEAVGAHNSTADRARFHSKGAGNGYVVILGGRRIYISGDTEDVPEMRALKDIDVAFLCINQPYTMTEQQAVGAIRAFKPKIVYPYHSRGSDLEKLKSAFGADSGVEVRLRNWY